MAFIKHALWTSLLWVLIFVVDMAHGQETVSFTLYFFGGSSSCTSSNCNINETYVTDFACSDGRGGWNGGYLSFEDPIPPHMGYVLWNVTATAYGRFDCNGTYSEDLLGIIIIDGKFLSHIQSHLIHSLPSNLHL